MLIDWNKIELNYSKALRCMFFGTTKNPCSSKFVQVELLNRVRERSSKNCAAEGFHYINPIRKRASARPCSLRQCSSRPYCTWLKICFAKEWGYENKSVVRKTFWKIELVINIQTLEKFAKVDDLNLFELETCLQRLKKKVAEYFVKQDWKVFQAYRVLK